MTKMTIYLGTYRSRCETSRVVYAGPRVIPALIPALFQRGRRVSLLDDELAGIGRWAVFLSGVAISSMINRLVSYSNVAMGMIGIDRLEMSMQQSSNKYVIVVLESLRNRQIFRLQHTQYRYADTCVCVCSSCCQLRLQNINKTGSGGKAPFSPLLGLLLWAPASHMSACALTTSTKVLLPYSFTPCALIGRA